MSDTEILAEVALYAKTGRTPTCVREWADLTFRLLSQRDKLAEKLRIDPDSLTDSGGFNMRNFGFSDLVEDNNPIAAAEDRMMRILGDNPEIADSFPDNTGFAKTETLLDREFFSKNPEIAIKMSANGRDVEAVEKDFKSAFDALTGDVTSGRKQGFRP